MAQNEAPRGDTAHVDSADALQAEKARESDLVTRCRLGCLLLVGLGCLLLVGLVATEGGGFALHANEGERYELHCKTTEPWGLQ